MVIQPWAVPATISDRTLVNMRAGVLFKNSSMVHHHLDYIYIYIVYIYMVCHFHPFVSLAATGVDEPLLTLGQIFLR